MGFGNIQKPRPWKAPHIGSLKPGHSIKPMSWGSIKPGKGMTRPTMAKPIGVRPHRIGTKHAPHRSRY
jgi:hypothetical protein